MKGKDILSARHQHLTWMIVDEKKTVAFPVFRKKEAEIRKADPIRMERIEPFDGNYSILIKHEDQECFRLPVIKEGA